MVTNVGKSISRKMEIVCSYSTDLHTVVRLCVVTLSGEFIQIGVEDL